MIDRQDRVKKIMSDIPDDTDGFNVSAFQVSSQEESVIGDIFQNCPTDISRCYGQESQ